MRDSTSHSADVAIAGAGIGGLSAALALHARGIRAVVIEAAQQIRPLGVGINIQPAAIAELHSLGLGSALAATGIATRAHRYLDHAGTVLWEEPRGLGAGHGHPQYSIHRGHLQTLLLDAVRQRLGAGAVLTGSRVRSFTDDGERVRIDATGAVIEAGALIGADGLRSRVRSMLHPDGDGLSAGGVDMWRGLSEMDQFLDGQTMVIANDGAARRLVAYPVSAEHAARGRPLVNWVCLVPSPPDRAAGDADWGRPGQLSDVAPHYADWDFGWMRVDDLVARSAQILYYPMVDRDPLATWGRGRVNLLGDAAHLMYPIGANGASQAIIDAARLAAELACGDVVAALQRYEAARRPATTDIILANRRMDRAERAGSARPHENKADTLAKITRDYREAVERRTS
jgi:2-polyprenyl-6-methoxyphenol hydroxylase-like FAD-dependent oxidoreductase